MSQNGYNFTERVRKVLAMAREEAASLHHEYVGTEHIVLGLLREAEGVGFNALYSLGVDMQELRMNVEAEAGRGKSGRATGPDLPYTSRAKKVLELSMAEARDLEHTYVGTEHLLLGLLCEEKGIAAQALLDAGIDLRAARAEVLRLLGTDAPRRRNVASEPIRDEVSVVRKPSRRRATLFVVTARFSDGTMTEKQFGNKAKAIVFIARQ